MAFGILRVVRMAIGMMLSYIHLFVFF